MRSEHDHDSPSLDDRDAGSGEPGNGLDGSSRDQRHHTDKRHGIPDSVTVGPAALGC
jgi:hypothetical protein